MCQNLPFLLQIVHLFVSCFVDCKRLNKSDTMAARSTASIQFQSVSNPMNYSTVTSNSIGHNTGSPNQVEDEVGYNPRSNPAAMYNAMRRQHSPPTNSDDQGYAMDTETATGNQAGYAQESRPRKALLRCSNCVLI